MPELFILIKIKIKHGKDHLQYCTKTVQTFIIEETPQICIYTASKTVFICLAHNSSEKDRRGVQHLQVTRNVCRTVNQLKKRGWQGNPASSAMSLQCWSQGMCEVGAGQDPAPHDCGTGTPTLLHCHLQTANHPRAGPGRAFEDGWTFAGQLRAAKPGVGRAEPSSEQLKTQTARSRGRGASCGRCQTAPTTGMCWLRHGNQKILGERTSFYSHLCLEKWS